MRPQAEREVPGPDSVRSVLVYSMDELIGDGLVKLPVIAALADAFPQARLSWAAAKGFTAYAGPLAPVVEGVLHDIVTTPPTGAGPLDWMPGRAPFGGRRWEVVIDTQENVGRSLVARRAADRLFISGALGGLLSDRKPTGPEPVRIVERLLRLVSLAAGREIAARRLPLGNERARAAALALLPEGPTYVGFAPGAGGANKRWPLDRYLELAQRQAARGRTPVFFLGPQELEEQEAVRRGAPGARLPEFDRADAYPEVRGPLLVIALAGRLAAAVANDAGPAHMLAAGGAPLLSLHEDRRRAVKFRPEAVRTAYLAADDLAGSGAAISAIPLEAVDSELERLVDEARP
jgi:ADP-heptose:LPS heptosyltransferase